MADKGKFAAWGNRVGVSTLNPVITRWNPTNGLPQAPKTGDRYIATATSHGWTNTRIYQWTGAVWAATVPAANAEVYLSLDAIYLIFAGGAWVTLLPVITRWNPTGGLPAAPNIGDRYIATATANGWTNTRIYRWSGAAWTAKVPAANTDVYLSQDGVYLIFESGVWKPLVSHIQAGRNDFVKSTPDPRACEWNGAAVRGTIRRGRTAWAKARV